jgi:hypothetical protein
MYNGRQVARAEDIGDGGRNLIHGGDSSYLSRSRRCTLLKVGEIIFGCPGTVVVATAFFP